MKKFSACILSLIPTVSLFAQTEKQLINDNYVNEAFKGVYIVMPDYREIAGGTRIQVTYDDNCPAELIGAFEHAVKLWEEVLPLSLPLNVSVNIGTIRGSGNLLSKVTLNSYDFSESPVNTFSSPLSRVKSVVLQEFNRGQQYSYISELDDSSLLTKDDFSITYNKSMLADCSYSLDGEPSEDKYDFVTVALRDIATGLGFTSNFTANTASRTLNITDAKMIPFQNHIMNALGTSNPSAAYVKATSGSLTLPILKSNLYLYAPEEWINGTSLRYFIPNEHPLSKILTHDFGKGYIVRDLTGANWNDTFRYGLDWQPEILTNTGSPSNSITHSGNSNDGLPFSGEATIAFNSRNNATISTESDIQNYDKSLSAIAPSPAKTIISHPVSTYCSKFNCYAPDTYNFWGVAVSVLLKDGSWDCIYEDETYPSYSITINMDNLKLNHPEDRYARGTTGGLRYRVSFCRDDFSGKGTYNIIARYFTRDFYPSKANIKYSEELNTQNAASNLVSLADDDYFVDVKVGIANVEGVSKITVEQLDEGEVLPFQYDVTDFRKGYFIANCDRELKTTLTVISYNEHGYNISNTITIPPIGYPAPQISFVRKGNLITVQGMAKSKLESHAASYEIYNISNPLLPSINGIMSSSDINIDDIPNGLYVVTIKLNSEIIGRYKFAKQIGG